MKPQIIDRYVYVKGKKISEVDNKTVLDGTEYIPLALNDMNYSTTVDTISDYVDSVHDYLTTGDYNDLKGQIDSERTNRQEADNELNQSIQNTKSELHSTISNVESELLNEVSDLQELINNINDTGIASGVTLDTVLTITGQKTFTTVPKSTADATEDTDLVNKKYVDNIANASFVFTSEELNSGLPSNRLNECINAYNNNKIFCIQRDNGEKIPAKIKIDTVSNIIIVGYDDIDPEETGEGDELNIYSKFVTFYKSTGEIRNEQNVSFLFSKRHGSNVYLNGSGTYSRPTKETVGLGNVDNTSDLDKPVSTATQVWVNELGFAKTSDIPEGLELGETASTAFPGDRGKTVEDKVSGLTGYYVGRKNSDILMYETTTEDSVSLNYYKFDFNNPDAPLSNQRVTLDAATTSAAGVMSAADKQKLDSLSDSSNVYIVDYITENSGTVTLELYNEIKTAIENNKVIVFILLYDIYIVTFANSSNDKLTLLTSLNDSNSSCVRVVSYGIVINSNYEYSVIDKRVLLFTNGDGTKFLSDNGTYNTIEIPDLSNYVDNDTFNESITALDNIYLRKTGGTVSGNLQVNSSVRLNDNNDILDIKYSNTDTLESEGKTFIRYNTSANGFIDIGTSGTSGPSSIVAYLAIRIEKAYNERDYKTGLIYINGSKKDLIFHESNISGSKVTTNDISGGLNITSITQSAYDGLDSKDANTLYIITE